MNVKEWLFSDIDELKKAVETMRSLFYDKKEDGEWEDIEHAYESCLLELFQKNPTTEYQHAKLQIRPEKLGEEVYCEVYATEGERSFGIDFIPWSHVLGMDVEAYLNHEKPKHELIAHFLLELTFDGFTEEDMEERRGEFVERVMKAEAVDDWLNPLED